MDTIGTYKRRKEGNEGRNGSLQLSSSFSELQETSDYYHHVTNHLEDIEEESSIDIEGGGVDIHNEYHLPSYIENQNIYYYHHSEDEEEIQVGSSDPSLDANEQGANSAEFWNQKYSELRDFKNAHGHSSPSYLSHPQLYSWLHRQKYHSRRDRLSAERQNLLSEIGVQFGFHWNERFQQLLNYKNQYHTVLVDNEKDPKLNDWVWSQINSWKSGKMNQERIKQLQMIGVRKEMDAIWVPQRPIAKKKRKKRSSEEKIPNQLSNDHSSVSLSNSHPLNLNMGIESDFISSLNSNWENPNSAEAKTSKAERQKSNANWNQMYANLKMFKNIHNSVSVPIKTDKKLNLWIRTQRKSFREGRIDDWKHKKLEKLGLVFPEAGATKQSGKNLVYQGLGHSTEEDEEDEEDSLSYQNNSEICLNDLHAPHLIIMNQDHLPSLSINMNMNLNAPFPFHHLDDKQGNNSS